MRLNHFLTALATLGLALSQPVPAHACHDGSPLVLDLNGDGLIRTSSDMHPVTFDLDGDGHGDRVLWTFWEDEDGFLFLDRNHNGSVDHGGELFGDATLLPSGELAADGFAALAVHDRPEHDGDADGVITSGDSIWRELRVWIDRDHDGLSRPSEIAHLARFGIVGIGLDSVETDVIDGNGNGHYLQGSYLRAQRGGGTIELIEFPVHDVYFKVLHHE